MPFSIFGKQVVIGIFITVFFIFTLGIISVWTVKQFERENPFTQHAHRFVEFLKSVPEKDRVATIERIDQQRFTIYQFLIIDKKGNLIYPKGVTLSFNWNDIPLPQKNLDIVPIPENKPGPPRLLIRLDDHAEKYLLLEDRGPPSRGRHLFLFNFLTQIFSVVLGTTLSGFIIFYTLRQRAKLADSVISELQRGNLKARFPIKKLDEAGQAMLRFNKMADEIERLVEQLRTTEKGRMSLLQELAHDLRTPVASLKSMLETLSNKDNISLEVKTELFSLSLKEVDYFANLVEDLLFLAQASDPRYQQKPESVDIPSLLNSEIESLERYLSHSKKKISFSQNFENIPPVHGDLHLLQRLFRNALDNASSFAKSSVGVTLRQRPLGIECLIQDDGPGFTPEVLKTFGQRKVSRHYTSGTGRRASIGLGSVIMQTVTSLHRGNLQASNRTSPQGEILGAEIKIELSLV